MLGCCIFDQERVHVPQALQISVLFLVLALFVVVIRFLKLLRLIVIELHIDFCEHIMHPSN